MKNCIFCDHELEDSYDHLFIQGKYSLIVVKDIPCKSCSSCGEIYYNDLTASKIQQLRTNYQKSEITQDSFVNYKDVAS